MQTLSLSLPKCMLCALAGGLLSGCETARDCSLTYKLWNNTEMRHFYEPAAQPRLELFHDTMSGDVLASYDEAHEIRTVIRRRAYFVNQNRLRVEAGHKPRFVKPERAFGLTPIPTASSALPESRTLQAIISTNGQQFAVNGDFGGHSYRLPVYQDQSGMAGRVLLSPLAVTGDVIMVGIVTGVVAAFLWASSGFQYCR